MLPAREDVEQRPCAHSLLTWAAREAWRAQTVPLGAPIVAPIVASLRLHTATSTNLPLRQGSAPPRPQLLIHLGPLLCSGAVSPSPQGLGPLPPGPGNPAPRLTLAADPC